MAVAAPPATTEPPRGPLRMTPARVTALAIGVPVALLLIANSALSLLAPFATGYYPVNFTAPAHTTSLTVNSDGGTLSVRSAKADGRVTLHGTAKYSFIHSTFTAQANGGDTAMNYHCAPLPSANCGLDATVGVPAGLPVSVNTDGGNAMVSGTSDPVTLHSSGGNLSATNVSGPLNLSTDGGNIQLDGITAPLTASTMGGGIRGAGITSDTVKISTSGGNIQVADVNSRTVRASTGGGNIEIDFTAVPRSVHVNTAGGNILLVLPPGPDQYSVDAHTDGGNVVNGLSHNSASTGHAITATSGGGNIILIYGLRNHQ